MRLGAALTATAFGCSVGVFGAAGPAFAAGAADASTPTNTLIASSVSLPYTTATGLVVDAAAGHVFVSGGRSSSAVEVLNLAGQLVGSITGQPGAVGLALSPDGSTLYIADSTSFDITAVNASTLAQTAGYSTGVAAPSSLTVAGGKLWFTSSGDDFLHDVNLSTGAVATTTASTSSTDSILRPPRRHPTPW
jgi:YVTN family beta-propeller protein